MKPAVFIVLLSAVTGCAKKEISAPPDAGYDYYPLAIGRFSIFETDSVVYQEIPKDTIHYRYLIKEVLSDTFTDTEGRTAWRMERYIKHQTTGSSFDSLPWTIKDVWMVNADKFKVQVVEENVRRTKLIFPVANGRRWNGNASNSEPASDCFYESAGQPDQVGQTKYDQAVRVVRRDFRTLISYELECEKFARGKGMVYREYRELFSNNIVSQLSVEQRIEKGVVFTQTLVASGYE